MKTHVIQLDKNDDYISVRDKISWTKAARILLILPPGARILARSLDLRILKRFSATLGAQLAVVTTSTEMRAVCKEVGLAVFSTTSAARHDDWGPATMIISPTRRRRKPDLRKERETLQPQIPGWQSAFAFRIAFFALGILAVFTVLLFFLPSAAIELTPKTMIQQLTLRVEVNFGSSDPGLESRLPASYPVVSVIGSQTVQASGAMTIPNEYASGIVHFDNLTESEVVIKAGTVVRTLTSPAVRFATEEDVVLPAASLTEVVPDQGLDILVQALAPGPAGNVPAGTLTSIEGGLGASLSVVNPEIFGGGTQTSVPAPTAEDRARVRQMLMADLTGKCLTDLLPSLPPGVNEFPGMLVADIVGETYFPAENQPGKTVSLTMELICTGGAANTAGLTSSAPIAQEENVPVSFQVFDGFEILEQGDITILDGTAHWDITVERTLQAQIDPIDVVQLCLGRKPGEAVQSLETNLFLSGKPIITLTPTWWPWMPVIPIRITILETGG